MWLLLLVCFLPIVYFICYKRLFYWKRRGISQLPVIDVLLSLISPIYRNRSFAEILLAWYSQFPNNRYAGIYQLFVPTLMLRDPELIKQITIKDFDHFTDHMLLFRDGVEPVFEKNLFMLRGEKWWDMRSTLSPSFTSSKMRGMFVFMSECAQEFVQCLANQNVDMIETEMKENLTRFTNDVIASAAFSIKCNSLKEWENDFYMMGKKMTSFGGVLQILKFALAMLSPKVLKLLGMSVVDREGLNYFKNMIVSNVETRERENIIRPDMIHLLMEARRGKLNNEIKKDSEDAGFAVVEETDIGKERQKPTLTIEDLTAQAFVFFLAAFDSVATVLCFLSHELAVNPDIHKRLQHEIDAHWNQYGSVTYEGIAKMKYMDRVISESLRKWPALLIADRVCTISYTIEPTNQDEKPVQLNKGEVVWIPIYAIHRDPQYYLNPDQFDPERFSAENKSNIRPCTYLPFGSGPRSCVANRFAVLEMNSIFCHLLRAFDIVPTAKTQHPIKLDKAAFNLQAEKGFWVCLKRRHIEWHMLRGCCSTYSKKDYIMFIYIETQYTIRKLKKIVVGIPIVSIIHSTIQS